MLLGQTSAQAGLRLAPFTAGIPIGSLSTGLLVNKSGRYYFLGILCISTFAAGALAISTFSLTTPVFPQFFNFFVLGCGYGGTLTVTVLALVSTVRRSDQAVVTSANYAFRSTGGTIGATIGSAVFQNVLARRLREYLGDGKEAADVIRKVRERFGEFEGLPERWKGLVALAYMDALHAVFWTSLALGVAAIICCSFMRENVLHKTLDRK
jgi:MFS family permease